MLGSPGLCLATEPKNLQADYTIETWSQSDGLPPGFVRAVEQDKQGYLWIGSDAGLYRFDGLHFAPVRPAGSALQSGAQIRALCASRDGSLWIGLGTGRVLRLVGNEVLDFGSPGELTRDTVNVLIEDSTGTLWVGGSQGLFRRTVNSAGDWAVVKGPVSNGVLRARLDRAGRLLVVTPTDILRSNLNDAQFEHVPGALSGRRDIFEAADGTLYQTDETTGFRKLGDPDFVSPYGPTRGRHLAIDHQGALWVGTGGQGLWRWTPDASTGRMVAATITASTGLPAGGVVALKADRDGNIWVGTPAGLSRLTRRRVELIPNLVLVAGAEQTPDGNAWVGTADELIRFTMGNAANVRRWSLGGAQLRALHVDRKGTLWVATDQFLAHHSNDQLVRLPAAGPFPRRIDIITSDGHGGAVLQDLDRGLLRWRTGQFTRVHLPDALQGQTVHASHTDREGRVWLAFANGQVLYLAGDDHFVVHFGQTGESGGRFVDIMEDRAGGLWFAGDIGLAKFVDGRFSTVRRQAGFFASSLTSLVEDRAGDLWLGSNLGVTHVERREIEKALIDQTYEPTHVTYDRADGLAGLPVPYSRNRNSLRLTDGKLWFLTGQGVTVIDPATIAVRREPPNVYVEALVVNDIRFGSPPSTALPSRTSRIDVEYSALDVTFGSRIQFRYQLEGYDPTWVAAGTRRQVSYANLPPQTYRFRVSASGGDGRWVESATSWDFSIRPVFYRTSWFFGLVIAVVSALVWAAWRMRLRRVRREFSLLLTERARVSREIHDRLLQNLVALTLEFDAAAFDTAHSWTKDQLVRWRRQVEQYIVEARQSIWNLRVPASEDRELSTRVRELCERSASVKPPGFIGFELAGSPYSCSTNVEEQVLRIAQEAVINAVQHSEASRVKVALLYEGNELQLEVSDDGVGFDQAAQAATLNRHYGLKTMNERAEDAGGRISITSSRDAGTTVTVSIPAPRRSNSL